ncbi:ABC transporter substrate-binding protein [Caldimonas manganoxidans]|uniref:ABC transporter substrate-binding protein n=1 Tax=Caldimonas manganoxidans TaxID=196015 RepID=UPI0003697DE5|nr:ABC transporter substrate-binding protein [Caldimonas manganoxidans]
MLGRVLMAWGLSACLAVSAQAQMVKPVRIGLIAPLTGDSADLGLSMRHAAELAVKEINAVGGYLGRPLELVVRDDRSDPRQGRQAAQELVQQEKVAFTLGFCDTEVTVQALEIFQSQRHVLMVPCDQGSAVMDGPPAAGGYVFRLAPPDELTARVLVGEIVDRRKLRKVALLADRTAYGDSGLKDLDNELAQRELKPVYVGRFDRGVKSLLEDMRQARAAGSEAVIVWARGADQAAALRARAEVRWTVPYFAPPTLASRKALEGAGAAALEGAVMTQTVHLDAANERRATFLTSYFTHSGEKRMGSLMVAAQTYDAVYLLVSALFQSRSPEGGEPLKRALENLDKPHRGVVTTYERPYSTRDHEAYSINMLWLSVWRGGEVQFLYPIDAQRASVIRRKEF